MTLLCCASRLGIGTLQLRAPDCKLDSGMMSSNRPYGHPHEFYPPCLYCVLLCCFAYR
jgi:hypothetical protein